MTSYYDVVEVPGGYRGRVYSYDESGDREVVHWTSDQVFSSPAEAMDAAVEWADENELEVELG